jgi:hypothetical protein
MDDKTNVAYNDGKALVDGIAMRIDDKIRNLETELKIKNEEIYQLQIEIAELKKRVMNEF